MRALLQRVTEACVQVEGRTVGAIETGLVALVGITHSDTAETAQALAAKIRHLRILRDERSVSDVPDAGVLAVSQFTLYGDARKGRRPTWAAAAPGPAAEPVFEAFVEALRDSGTRVQTGVFGADMRVHLVNDGPVTLLVEL